MTYISGRDASGAASDFAVGTIIAPNYQAFARVLARSLQRFHPQMRLTTLVLDESSATPQSDEQLRVIRPGELPIEPRRFHDMAAMYSIMELATALKPWLLEFLIQQGARSAVFLDPDIELFQPLDAIGIVPDGDAFTVTPHVLRPVPRDGYMPDEEQFLISGTYNLGFIAVGQDSSPFLHWWQERLSTHCVVALEDGLFVDQRWIDLAVHFFPHRVLRDPGFDVAYWNLHEREVSWTGSEYRVNGGPLTAFHFSGYDPRKPSVLSKHTRGRPRFLLSNGRAVDRLVAGYRQKLLDQRWEDTRHLPYAYEAATGGLRLGRSLRQRYRNWVLLGKTPPDPFDRSQESAFEHWARQSLYELIVDEIRDVRVLARGTIWRAAAGAQALRAYLRGSRQHPRPASHVRWRRQHPKTPPTAGSRP